MPNGGIVPPKPRKQDKNKEEFKLSNRYDPYEIKDAVEGIIQSYLKEKHSASLSSSGLLVRIYLSFVMCSITLYSHYGTPDFPECVPYVTWCILIFIALYVVLIIHGEFFDHENSIVFNIEVRILNF